MLGSLLAELYHQQNDRRLLSLLLSKERTVVAKEKVLELLSSRVYAFALSRRWKLLSKEYLDIAMQRVAQGFLSEGCQVANYNLVKTADLEHFYSRKHHRAVAGLVGTADEEEGVVHLLALIGMAARFPQIRTEWVGEHLHTRVFKFGQLYPRNVKITGNLCFALSALTFEENSACLDIIKQTDLMNALLGSMRAEPSHLAVAQYGSLFLGNLSFSRCFEANAEVPVGNVVDVLKLIFEANLVSDNLSPYKHLLKALGNMSLIPECSAMMLVDSFCQNMAQFA